MQQLIRKRKVAAQITNVFLAKAVQARKYLTKSPFKPWVESRARFFRDWDIDEPPVGVDGRVPAALGLKQARISSPNATSADVQLICGKFRDH